MIKYAFVCFFVFFCKGRLNCLLSKLSIKQCEYHTHTHTAGSAMKPRGNLEATTDCSNRHNNSYYYHKYRQFRVNKANFQLIHC